MDLGRRLLKGVGGWLQFEFQCHRAQVFSEKYLSVPIAQVLTAYHGTQVYAEVLHPVLAPLMTGPGRRPEVDFAVQDPFPHFKVAIETKWHGTTPVTLEDVAWDIVRLALIHKATGANCYFLLGGRRDRLMQLFSGIGFVSRQERSEKPILPTTRRELRTIRPASPLEYQVGIFKKLFSRHQSLDLPAKIKVVMAGIFPEQSANYEYQICVWKINASGVTFRPQKHRFYRTRFSGLDSNSS